MNRENEIMNIPNPDKSSIGPKLVPGLTTWHSHVMGCGKYWFRLYRNKELPEPADAYYKGAKNKKPLMRHKQHLYIFNTLHLSEIEFRIKES